MTMTNLISPILAAIYVTIGIVIAVYYTISAYKNIPQYNNKFNSFVYTSTVAVVGLLVVAGDVRC